MLSVLLYLPLLIFSVGASFERIVGKDDSFIPRLTLPLPENHTRDGIPDGVVCDETRW